MNVYRKLLTATAVAAVSLISVVAHAQPSGRVPELTDAEVRKVDKDGKKITLKHSEIKNLDMPPMTMVFTVIDAALLDKVQAGDKVRFKAVNEGGKMTVTEIQPAK